jgi:hypothetical protein
MSNMSEIRECFRGLMLRELRPIEDKDGLRIGEDVRIIKEKDAKDKGYTVRFLKGTAETRKKMIRDKLRDANISFKEDKDYKD